MRDTPSRPKRVRLLSMAVVSLAVPGLTALPVVALPTPAPIPVKPTLRSLSLTGVDAKAALSAPGLPTSIASSDGAGTKEGPASTGTPIDAALTPAVSTQPFSIVAVTWSAAEHPMALHSFVRTRSSGKWSGWQEIPTGEDHGPNADSAEAAAAGGQARGGTDPLFVAESDGVQVRVLTAGGVRPKGLRVDLVDPGESAADAAVGVLPPGAAQAAVSQPQIFSRADWGADENLKTGGAEYGVIKGAFVHHTAGANTYDPEDVPGIIRGIYAYHVLSRGWRDIGYNFVVDRFGRIWEGRYGGVDQPVIGAHTLGYNHESFAMSTLGTLTGVSPTSATLDAYSRLFAWKLDMHGVAPKSTVTLHGTSFQAISGHRDAASTECPGERLYAALPTIRSRTNALVAVASANGVDPVTVDEVYPVGSDGVLDMQGHGWGHGLGMSQHGAKGAALEGLTYPEILSFYYQGTQVTGGYTRTMRVLLEGETDADVRARPERNLSVRYFPQGSTTSRRLTLPTTMAGKPVQLWRVRSWKNDLVIQGWNGTWTYLLSGRYVDGERAVDFIPADGHLWTENAATAKRTKYRGWIRGQRAGAAVTATNYVPLELYLRSVVASEMPTSWPAEALKSQAVAARSYALAEAASRAGGTFDVYDSTRSQVYRGYGAYDANWRETAVYEASSATSAVSGTLGRVLTYEGAVARTSFSSSNGGLTSGAGSYPWEKTYVDPFDPLGGSSRQDWTDSVSAATLQSRFPAIGALNQVRVTRRSGAGDWEGRILVLRLEGSAGSVTVTGDTSVRWALGTNSSYLTFV